MSKLAIKSKPKFKLWPLPHKFLQKEDQDIYMGMVEGTEFRWSTFNANSTIPAPYNGYYSFREFINTLYPNGGDRFEYLIKDLLLDDVLLSGLPKSWDQILNDTKNIFSQSINPEKPLVDYMRKLIILPIPDEPDKIPVMFSGPPFGRHASSCTLAAILIFDYILQTDYYKIDDRGVRATEYAFDVRLLRDILFKWAHELHPKQETDSYIYLADEYREPSTQSFPNFTTMGDPRTGIEGPKPILFSERFTPRPVPPFDRDPADSPGKQDLRQPMVLLSIAEKINLDDDLKDPELRKRPGKRPGNQPSNPIPIVLTETKYVDRSGSDDDGFCYKTLCIIIIVVAVLYLLMTKMYPSNESNKSNRFNRSNRSSKYNENSKFVSFDD